MRHNNIHDTIIDKLSNLDEQTLSVAYLYATNYCKYGVDITTINTAVQNHQAIERSYYAGYAEGYREGRYGNKSNSSSDCSGGSIYDEFTAL